MCAGPFLRVRVARASWTSPGKEQPSMRLGLPIMTGSLLFILSAIRTHGEVSRRAIQSDLHCEVLLGVPCGACIGGGQSRSKEPAEALKHLICSHSSSAIYLIHSLNLSVPHLLNKVTIPCTSPSMTAGHTERMHIETLCKVQDAAGAVEALLLGLLWLNTISRVEGF